MTEGSALDREALNRATSVLCDRSCGAHASRAFVNGICSLNPQVDRLTQSAIMEIDNMVVWSITPLHKR